MFLFLLRMHVRWCFASLERATQASIEDAIGASSLFGLSQSKNFFFFYVEMPICSREHILHVLLT